MTAAGTGKVHIIFFSFGILEQGGGFENYLVTTTRGLADRYDNLEISIVTMSPKIVERLQGLLSIYFMKKQTAEHIYRESLKNITEKLGPVHYRRANSLAELASLLQKGDVIYSKNEVLEMATLHRIGVRKLPPILVGVHTPIYYPHTPSLSAKLHNIVYTGPIYRYFIKHVKAVQVHNKDDVELIKTKLRYPNVKLVSQAFESPPLKAHKTKDNVLRLLFVGRLTEAKGIDLLVEIIGKLGGQYNGPYHLKIAGSGDEATVRQVEKMASNNDSVTYLGHVPNEKITELYDWTDLTLVPSKYETLNKVAIETAQAGKIALCTDIPGPREIIKNGQTGYLISPSSEAFVGQIIELAALKHTSPRDFYDIGEAAYDYIKQKFNPQKAYGDMYQDFISVTRKG
jgi:glycosyltransferase involved in cell wall biosynthesis